MKKALMCLALTMVSTAAFAELKEYRANDKVRIRIAISSQGANRFMVKKDRISKVIGNDDDYFIEGDASRGHVFIIPKTGLLPGVQVLSAQSPSAQAPGVQVQGVQTQGVQTQGVQTQDIQGAQVRDVQMSCVQTPSVQTSGVQMPEHKSIPITIITEKGIIQDISCEVNDIDPASILIVPKVLDKRIKSSTNQKTRAIKAIKEVISGDVQDYSFKRVREEYLPNLPVEIIGIREYSNREFKVRVIECEGGTSAPGTSTFGASLVKYYPRTLAIVESGTQIIMVEKV